MRILWLVLLLSGCGHLNLNLKAHEEEHCEEFGVTDKSKWNYVYASAAETTRTCQQKTGLIFVDGCAQKVGYECYIHLPARCATSWCF